MANSFEEEITAQAIREAIEMRKRQAEAAASKGPLVTRPERDAEVTELENEISQNVRQNVNAILDVESQVEGGLTKRQLGRAMGYKSLLVYDQLSDAPRTNIGMATICKLSRALNIAPHILMLPHKQFKKAFVVPYREGRLGGGDGTAKRSGKK